MQRSAGTGPSAFTIGLARAAVSIAGLLVAAASPVDAGETVRYRLDVAIDWSAETHPHEFPNAPHLTAFVGATHHGRYTLFRDGDTASSGLESVAERGRTRIVTAELESQKERGRIGSILIGPALSTVPGEISLEFETTERHSRVSFVSMIAPSTDWFTGFEVVLRAEEGWTDRVSVPLFVWDAGTDHGTTFTDPGMDTQPRQSIRLLATPHFAYTDGLRPIGRATLTLIGTATD